MNKEIICFLLDEFADWEGAFIAPALNFGIEPGKARYRVKTMSVTKDPVTSIGGFKVIPDYDVNDYPRDYAGLILIGGMSWLKPEAAPVLPLLKVTAEQGKLIAGICNASVFLGMHGFLNEVRHTSNTLAYLKQCAGGNYTGDALYQERQAVRDGNVVTANGTGYLEFCREIMHALEADTPEKIEEFYRFNKEGFVPAT